MHILGCYSFIKNSGDKFVIVIPDWFKKKTIPNFTVLQKDWAQNRVKKFKNCWNRCTIINNNYLYVTGHYKETLWLFYITFSGPVKKSQKAWKFFQTRRNFQLHGLLPSLNSLLNILPLILKITAFVLFAFILICHFLT